jgi:hypothetical protein
MDAVDIGDIGAIGAIGESDTKHIGAYVAGGEPENT